MSSEIQCDNCKRVPTRKEILEADKLCQPLICQECLSDVFVTIPDQPSGKKKPE